MTLTFNSLYYIIRENSKPKDALFSSLLSSGFTNIL